MTVEQSEQHLFFVNAASAPGNHSYYLLFNDFMYSVCILIYVSMDLYIYIATHLHTVNLGWLQAVLESNSKCA
jgi:hypothetical protein